MIIEKKDIKGAFTLAPMDDIYFGSGSISNLASVLEKYNVKNALLVTGHTLKNDTDLVDKVVEHAKGRITGVFHETKAHVPRQVVLNVANKAREMGADALISFGGGSPNDTAKTALMALSEGIEDLSGFDRMMIKFEYPDKITVPEFQGDTLPMFAIPTTLSAGEYTWFAGITDEERQVKDLYLGKKMTAKAVFLDAELTLQTPQWLWLSSGIRAVDHCVETICSLEAHPFTDGTCSQALPTLNRFLRDCKDNPDDLAARTQLQIASWMAFCGVANVNLGLSHGIGHQLGARCGVPHGITSCVMLHNVLRYNLEYTKDRQDWVAELLATGGRKPASAADGVLDLVKYIEQPYRLRDVGVTKEDFRGIAEDAMADLIVATNPRTVSSIDEVIQILEDAY